MSRLPTRPPSRALANPYEDEETVYAVLRSVTRLGPWQPPEAMRLVSGLGKIVLDYMEADLPLGVTEVDCEVYLGNIEIVVPSDIDVEITGSVILGSVETKSGGGRRDWFRQLRERLMGESEGPEEEYERPLLVVNCSGVMGQIEITFS